MDEPLHSYPVFLNLKDKPCLVVGGGRVAERRALRLIDCGARVTVVSPRASQVILNLASQGKLTHLAREYRKGDLGGCVLAVLATDQDSVHQRVLQDRQEAAHPALINDAMRPERGDFATPALFREGPLSVAVATGGLMPRLASALAKEVGRLFGPSASAVLRRYRRWRGTVASRRASGPEAVRALRRAVDRRLLEAFRSGDIGRVEAVLSRAEKLSVLEPRSPSERLSPSLRPADSEPGCVHLVGAGPGDPGLLTVRGRELIGKADAVVYDRLIDAELLALAAPGARLIPVGKSAGRHPMTQQEINRLLKELAASGDVVVRLKGGDPFVFGRGGEEAEYLRAEGVSFEVVPGVSSAVAVPAYAGIPLTHRALASSFAVVTGHKAAIDEPERPQATAEADTLVYLMGLANLPAIVEELVGRGKDPHTPVAVVSNGTTVRQKVVSATLGTIVEEVSRAELKPPAVIVVGEVARLAESLSWFEEGGARAFPLDEPVFETETERDPGKVRAAGA